MLTLQEIQESAKKMLDELEKMKPANENCGQTCLKKQIIIRDWLGFINET